ncbi:hypothetical protein E1A90_22660 [Bacillus mycoides]|nr:hypothetical protein E1A90_22660 [Bacillus mycoides]
MGNFKYCCWNLKLHKAVFEILIGVFEIGVKIKRFLLYIRSNLLFIYWQTILLFSYVFEKSIDRI